MRQLEPIKFSILATFTVLLFFWLAYTFVISYFVPAKINIFLAAGKALLAFLLPNPSTLSKI